MKRPLIGISLATLSACSLLYYCVSSLAQSSPQTVINDQEPNGLAQLAGELQPGDRFSFRGSVESHLIQSRRNPIRTDPDRYQIKVRQQNQFASLAINAKNSSDATVRVWTDKNNDRKTDGEQILQALPAGQAAAIQLPTGSYILEIVKNDRPFGKVNYQVEVTRIV